MTERLLRTLLELGIFGVHAAKGSHSITSKGERFLRFLISGETVTQKAENAHSADDCTL
jgi:hypothetical protein